MLHSNAIKAYFLGWFHLAITRMGDILDVDWVVSCVLQNIGRVTTLEWEDLGGKEGSPFTSVGSAGIFEYLHLV